MTKGMRTLPRSGNSCNHKYKAVAESGSFLKSGEFENDREFRLRKSLFLYIENRAIAAWFLSVTYHLLAYTRKSRVTNTYSKSHVTYIFSSSCPFGKDNFAY